MRKCPYCNSKTITRLHRMLFLKLVPFSKKYECRRCRGEFITIFQKLYIKLNQGYSRLILLK